MRDVMIHKSIILLSQIFSMKWWIHIGLNDSLVNWRWLIVHLKVIITDITQIVFLTQNCHMTPEDFENGAQWFFSMLLEALKISNPHCNWIENSDPQNKESYQVWNMRLSKQWQNLLFLKAEKMYWWLVCVCVCVCVCGGGGGHIANDIEVNTDPSFACFNESQL